MGRWGLALAARSHSMIRGEFDVANDWSIRDARAFELARLAEIEHEAGARFDAIPALADVPEVLMAPGALAAALTRGQVWVAAAAEGDVPVGFAYADLVDDGVHLEELDVLPAWGRRGIGRALVATVVAHARARGLRAVTLTTFRDVPWNAPFYARLGFEVLAPDEVSPGLVRLLEYEAGRGLPQELRVAMRYRLTSR
jgi:GNAT superfamily N-acetyltransferase